MPDRLLTRSEDPMLQMEMSAGRGGGGCNGCFCRDGSGNNWPSIDDFYSAKNKYLSSDISAQNAENHTCRKGTWSATGSNTTNWVMDLVSLVHSVIRNLPCLMIYILI